MIFDHPYRSSTTALIRLDQKPAPHYTSQQAARVQLVISDDVRNRSGDESGAGVRTFPPDCAGAGKSAQRPPAG